MFLDLFCRLKTKFLLIPDVFKTIAFNFHYLPLKQAVHLPIFLYNADIRNVKGTVSISPYGGG